MSETLRNIQYLDIFETLICCAYTFYMLYFVYNSETTGVHFHRKFPEYKKNNYKETVTK